MQADDKLYYIALSRIPFIGKVGFKAILSCWFPTGSSEYASWQNAQNSRSRSETRQCLQRKRRYPPKKRKQNSKQPEDLGIKLLTFLEKDYPKRLNQLMDAPPVLYTSGAADFNSPRMISIVGTRQATDYGKEVTDQIIADLAPYQPLPSSAD